MTIYTYPGFTENDSRFISHLPGVQGGLIGAGAKIAARLAGRGARRLFSRLFKPKRYTYRGAVGRGIGAGTLATPFLTGDDLDSTIPIQEEPTNGRQIKQRVGRRRVSRRGIRRNNRHLSRCCC